MEDEDTQHSIAYYCIYLFTSMEKSVCQSQLLVAHCVHVMTMTLTLTSVFMHFRLTLHRQKLGTKTWRVAAN